MWLGGYFNRVDHGDELVVYCASGVMPAVKKIAAAYESEFGVTIHLHAGSSGVLEQQLRTRRKGDLYIPAGRDPFLQRCRADGTVIEILPTARFRLVLAVRPGNEKNVRTLDDLLRDDVDVIIADEHAAVGKTTRKVLADWDRFAEFNAKATNKPRVTEVANDVQIGVRADVGLVWDSTARQWGLEIVEVDELTQHPGSSSTISVGVLSFSERPTAALRFARFLAAPMKGQPIFKEFHYETVAGDAWTVKPKLVFFSGGVNRLAVEETLKEFQEREGCEIVTTFQGCGSLVTMIRAGEKPDAYFACDASFVDQVADDFAPATDVSQTDMIMLVKPGNPKNIRTLADLGRADVIVGIADEQLTALGSLTMQLLQDAGVYDAVLKNRRATTPTADLLVTQLTTVAKLDAAIVYRANCNSIGDRGEIVSIDHPAAHATQPLAIHRNTAYPQMAERLMMEIGSARSRKRFEATGFTWRFSDGDIEQTRETAESQVESR
jgi:ABC-type molybdate transport system substrate-binding protein